MASTKRRSYLTVQDEALNLFVSNNVNASLVFLIDCAMYIYVKVACTACFVVFLYPTVILICLKFVRLGTVTELQLDEREFPVVEGLARKLEKLYL